MKYYDLGLPAKICYAYWTSARFIICQEYHIQLMDVFVIELYAGVGGWNEGSEGYCYATSIVWFRSSENIPRFEIVFIPGCYLQCTAVVSIGSGSVCWFKNLWRAGLEWTMGVFMFCIFFLSFFFFLKKIQKKIRCKLRQGGQKYSLSGNS